MIEIGEPKSEYEQTTFFEWLNSGFITIPCQQCHMPDSYQGNSLHFKIANIEDNTFPQFPTPDLNPPAGRRSDAAGAHAVSASSAARNQRVRA